MTSEIKIGITSAKGYDVIVCGGGPAGCAAAIAARRMGLSVLVVESTSQLGGMTVSGLVSHWLGGRTQEGEWVVGGIFKELAQETAEAGYSLIPQLNPNEAYHPYGWFNWFIHGIPYDPFSMALYLDGKMKKEGVDVLLCTSFISSVVEENRISHVILHNATGLLEIPCGAVIDSTGNAEVAHNCGCPTLKGRPEDGKAAPSSLIFHVYGVDTKALTKAIEENKDPKFRDLIAELRSKGIWNFPYDIFVCTKLTEDGVYFINTIRLCGVDGTDGWSVSDGLRRGREEVNALMHILRSYFPGFSNARLKTVAPALGVRESRHIVGEYVLTEEDLILGRDFKDCIGFSMYGWDLPDPDKPSIQPFADDLKSGFTPKVNKRPFTPLPYRMMVPVGISNLICPGRAVSAQGQALGPIRVTAPCMAMGQAAGTAAGAVIREGKRFSDVDLNWLRSALIDAGAIVDVARLPVIHPRIDQT